MVGLSQNGESLLLTQLLSSRFISLHTADPGNTGANEVSGFAYARVAGGTFNQSGNNPTSATNAAAIEFPVATGNWGTITHFGVWSLVSGGTFYGGWALTASKAYTTDDIARFLAGALTATLD